MFNKAERCHLYVADNDAQLGYTYPVAAYAPSGSGLAVHEDSGHAVSAASCAAASRRN